MTKYKLFRITTVPISLEKLLGKQLTFMTQYFDVTAISSDQEYLERVGKELGVKTHAITMTRKITPFRDIKSLWNMYVFFKKQKPNIVHSHTPKAGLIAMLAAKFAGVKVRLHTVAGLPLMEEKGVKRILLNFIEKLTYAASTKIFPNSVGLYNFILEQKFCDSDKLKIIGNGSTNGINLEYYNSNLFSSEEKHNFSLSLGISYSDFVFVFVGRLVKDKGINELVSAFSKMNVDNVKLLLVGSYESDLDPLLPQTLKEIKENPHILDVGYQIDVRIYFAISNCLVFPSYREGFPNVVMQAGAMGLPCIVTDINGNNEIIQDNINGLIVPVKDEVSVKSAMEKILSNTILYNRLKSSTREVLSERYSQQFVFNRILEEYKRYGFD